MKKKLGFWQQVALIFFTVSGGAYGLEALVGAVGATWSVILVIALPLLWAAPVALMVAELSTAIPEEGGYYIWVKRGLGKFWGFQEGWWTLCYSAVDLALYPVLFVTYLGFFFPTLGAETFQMSLLRWGICVVFIIGALLMNLRGTQAVGTNALANLMLVSFPFLLLTICGFFYGDWSLLKNAFSGDHLTHTTPAAIATGLAVVLWNYCGWDNVSTYASEVENPQKNYPRALSVSLLIIVLSYLLPLLAGFKATTTPTDWSEGAGWPAIAEKLAGSWLGILGGVAALLSAWALFNSQLLYISRLPTAMAKDGWLPKAIAKTSPQGSPITALLIMSGLAAVFSSLSLGKLMVVDILFYTLGLSLEFCALVALRKKEPHLARPFRIPLETFGLTILSIIPISLAVIVAVFSTMGEGGSFVQVGIVAAGVVAGVIIFERRSKYLHKKNFFAEALSEHATT
ncbi:MAG: APC family permease [bacterium]